MNYSKERKSHLMADPRFELLGEWKGLYSQVNRKMEISERNEHFFIFICESNSKGDFISEPEHYPLHYDKENDVFFFYRDGIRTELLKDEDEFLTIFPNDDFERIKGSFEDHASHLYY